MRTSRKVYPAAQGVGVAGKPTVIDLEAGPDTRFLCITLKARVTISVAVATSVRNLGQVAAMIDNFSILEGGKVTGFGDFRLWAFASEFLRGSQGTEVRQTSVAVGATSLVQRIMIPFERFVQLMPKETRYRVRNQSANFQLRFDWNAIPGERVLLKGGATLVTDLMTVDVRQYTVEGNDADLATFAPRWREQIFPVPAGANAAFKGEIEVADQYLAGFTVLQETTTEGLVTDILNSFQLRSDSEIFIGETGLVSWPEYLADREWESGGNIFASNNGSIGHLDFRDTGRLSNIISPSEATKLRFIFNLQASAAAGASQLRLLIHALSRDERVGPGGRRVISGGIPFAV